MNGNNYLEEHISQVKEKLRVAIKNNLSSDSNNEGTDVKDAEDELRYWKEISNNLSKASYKSTPDKVTNTISSKSYKDKFNRSDYYKIIYIILAFILICVLYINAQNNRYCYENGIVIDLWKSEYKEIKLSKVNVNNSLTKEDRNKETSISHNTQDDIIRSFKTVDGEVHNLPATQVDRFLSTHRDAVEIHRYTINGTNYSIPLDKVAEFLHDYPYAIPLHTYMDANFRVHK